MHGYLGLNRYMLKNTTAMPDSDNKNTDFQRLRTEVEQRTKLQEICNKINAALNLDEILIGLRDEITSLFEAERLTIYVLDGRKRKLVSKYKSGEEIRQISVPISPTSISGYTALKQKSLNIKNVYDKDELSSIDPVLKFDESWDKKSGFTTRQILTFPITYKKFLLSVIQLINRTDGGSFRKNDEEYLKELADIMAIALYNQKRMVKPKPGKFDSLLLNHVLTQKELDKAVADARQRKEPVESILATDFNVSKKDIG
jgi:transcriptional regulator with GAF, ATPase, and Fis domain